MALPGVAALTASLKALPTTPDPVSGGNQFANAIGNYMALASAGPGTPGILTFNSALFGSLVSTQPMDPTGAVWGPLMASNWQTALLASIVTPGTVSSPVWTASGVDILTLPSAAATIITAPVATAYLTSQLSSVKPDLKAPQPLAAAFDGAIKLLTFLCVGLTLVGVVPTPTPLPFTAQ